MIEKPEWKVYIFIYICVSLSIYNKGYNKTRSFFDPFWCCLLPSWNPSEHQWHRSWQGRTVLPWIPKTRGVGVPPLHASCAPHSSPGIALSRCGLCGAYPSVLSYATARMHEGQVRKKNSGTDNDGLKTINRIIRVIWLLKNFDKK